MNALSSAEIRTSASVPRSRFHGHGYFDCLELAVDPDSQILDGIEMAHLHGVDHRDLKPENVLFDPRAECLVVADFGIPDSRKQIAELIFSRSVLS